MPAVLSAIALAGILAACSASVSTGDTTPSVSGAELAPEVSKKLAASVGQTPDAMECPEEGLKGVVGATVTCVLTAGDDKIDVKVTATSVEGSKIDFEAVVADAVNPAPSES